MSHCVLLTRPQGSNDGLSQMLDQRGIRTLERPMQEIKPVAANAAKRKLALDLDQFDCVIFVSKNAVVHGMSFLEQYWPQWPQITWLAVGRSTAMALEKFDIHAEYPGKASSEGLLELPSLRAGLQLEAKILIVRGRGGRELLAEELSKRGALVSYLEIYQRVEVNYSHSLSEDLLASSVDMSAVTSLEGLGHLSGSLSRQIIGKLHLVVPSGRIEKAARDLGFKNVYLASGADDAALLQAILETTFIMGS